jgi:zinc finger RNA-binding protein
MLVCNWLWQAYKLHLEGKVHKKKEAAANNAKTMNVGSKVGGPGGFGSSGKYCKICEIACSCSDAYAAHIRGTKHQKVLLLATWLLLTCRVMLKGLLVWKI